MKLRYVFAVFLLLALLPARGQPMPAEVQGFAVIVNKSNAVKTFTRKQLLLVFKGSKKKWAGGKKIVPVNMPYGSEVRTIFDKAVLNFSKTESKEYWVEQRIKAKGSPPAVQKSSTGVKRFVAKVPDAIGYIPANEVDDSVKVVFRFSGKR